MAIQQGPVKYQDNIFHKSILKINVNLCESAKLDRKKIKRKAEFQVCFFLHSYIGPALNKCILHTWLMPVEVEHHRSGHCYYTEPRHFSGPRLHRTKKTAKITVTAAMATTVILLFHSDQPVMEYAGLYCSKLGQCIKIHT